MLLAKKDSNDELHAFANKLENACINKVEGGQMTKDLSLIAKGDVKPLTAVQYIDAVHGRLG